MKMRSHYSHGISAIPFSFYHKNKTKQQEIPHTGRGLSTIMQSYYTSVCQIMLRVWPRRKSFFFLSIFPKTCCICFGRLSFCLLIINCSECFFYIHLEKQKSDFMEIARLSYSRGKNAHRFRFDHKASSVQKVVPESEDLCTYFLDSPRPARLFKVI